jgi:hypothetical protein
MKVCTKCKIKKKLTEFSKSKSSKDGVRSDCKFCRKKWREENKQRIKKYYKENKELIKKRHKKYYEENKERINAQHKKWREENKEIIKQRKKKHYENNKKNINQKQQNYYQENKERIKELSKKWREENKEYIKKWRKQKQKTDPIFKFRICTRSLIRASFKRACNGQYRKSKRTEEMLGCDMDFFMRYIKSKFQKGMTFENYGEWHIDHIIPISSANTEEEIIALNHYTNLQPLWAYENLTKANKILEQQLVLL